MGFQMHSNPLENRAAMIEDKTAIRNAATVIVVRDRDHAPTVLMGQRGSKAAFMPNKFVFPGGAVDPQDGTIGLTTSIPEPCQSRLQKDADPTLCDALCVAAIRELFEETGQVLGQPGLWSGSPPEDWSAFAQNGYVPDAGGLQFVFRAITPPGRTRRFDARFFMVDADQLRTDLDDFTAASDELSHLQWIALEDVRAFDLPFITEVVLAEVTARIKDTAPPKSVPFFRNDDEESLFLRLRGHNEPYKD